MKKVCAVLLSLIFLMALIPTTLAETENTKITVETGYYDSDYSLCDTSYKMDADLAWFHNSSTEYNHKLAQLSFMLAIASFKDYPEDIKTDDKIIRSFFQQAGFSECELYDYNIVKTEDTIGSGFAYRKMHDSQGDYILLAAPICGQGYEDEWVNNFELGTGTEHEGFQKAAQKVFDRLLEYIEKNLKGKRIKLWTTGFSRSAAICNLFTHMVLEAGLFDEEEVFAYTFACPNTTKNPVEHPQIFNICNGFDGISKAPFINWGYGKHGSTFYLPTPSTRMDYAQVSAPAQKLFTEKTQQKDKITLPERNWFFNELLNVLGRYIPDAKTYATGYQKAVCAGWMQEGTIVDMLTTLIETAEENKCDTSGLENVAAELDAIITLSTNYAVNVALQNEEKSEWSRVLTSGTEILYEHFPLIYYVWIFSTDNPEELFDGNLLYNRVGFIGDPDVAIYSVDSETGKEKLLQDTKSGIGPFPIIRLSGTFFIELPSTENYKIVLTSMKNERISFVYNTCQLPSPQYSVSKTKPVFLYGEEKIEVTIPSGCTSRKQINVTLNGNRRMALLESDNNEVSVEVLRANGFSPIEQFFTWLLSVAPDVIGFVIFTMMCIIILIKRIIRGPVSDLTVCNGAGKVLLISVAVLAFFWLGICVLVICAIFAKDMKIDSVMFLEMTEVLDTSSVYYMLYISLVELATGVLAIRSIHHTRSRRRLLILSVVCFVCNVASFAVVYYFSVPEDYYLYYLLIPVLSVIAVFVANKAEVKE